MPRFDLTLSAQAQLAVAIARAGETVRAAGEPVGRREWTITRLEALYELAFLRVFGAWEKCLECLLYRSLCGYASSAGQETLHPGMGHGPANAYYPSWAHAEARVLGGGSFVLWHDASKVIARCRKFIRSGAGCPALQETTISSREAHLGHLGAIRHRIAHDFQEDARKNFDDATRALATRTYPASRPGKFLRDWNKSVMPNERWLDTAVSDLVSLANQMV
jgi:hypothetical protein